MVPGQSPADIFTLHGILLHVQRRGLSRLLSQRPECCRGFETRQAASLRHVTIIMKRHGYRRPYHLDALLPVTTPNGPKLAVRLPARRVSWWSPGRAPRIGPSP